MTKYRLELDGGALGSEITDAPDDDVAIHVAIEWAEAGDWSEAWRAEGYARVRLTVRDGEREAYDEVLTIHQPEPSCPDGEHSWVEVERVRSSGPQVAYSEWCSACGLLHVHDGGHSDRETGQYVESDRYRMQGACYVLADGEGTRVAWHVGRREADEEREQAERVIATVVQRPSASMVDAEAEAERVAALPADERPSGVIVC